MTYLLLSVTNEVLKIDLQILNGRFINEFISDLYNLLNSSNEMIDVLTHVVLLEENTVQKGGNQADMFI